MELHNNNVQIEWEYDFFEFLAALTTLTTLTHGKQQYFYTGHGVVYSRISGEYITLDEMQREYIEDIQDMFE